MTEEVPTVVVIAIQPHRIGTTWKCSIRQVTATTIPSDLLPINGLELIKALSFMRGDLSGKAHFDMGPDPSDDRADERIFHIEDGFPVNTGQLHEEPGIGHGRGDTQHIRTVWTGQKRPDLHQSG